jgi:hypothetical protein
MYRQILANSATGEFGYEGDPRSPSSAGAVKTL